MDLPASSWVNLALQIPLALVIVVLVVYFLRHLEKINSMNIDFMKREAEINRDFIKSQHDAHNQSVARLAEEIKGSKVEVVREVAELTKRVDGVIDKAIMLERLLPDKSK